MALVHDHHRDLVAKFLNAVQDRQRRAKHHRVCKALDADAGAKERGLAGVLAVVLLDQLFRWREAKNILASVRMHRLGQSRNDVALSGACGRLDHAGLGGAPDPFHDLVMGFLLVRTERHFLASDNTSKQSSICHPVMYVLSLYGVP